MFKKFKNLKRTPAVYISIIIIAILVTFCNYVHLKKNGFLSIDVAVWTNISKAIGQGKIIYRDVFDHKGPILYLFYSIGYLTAGQPGLFILDLVCNIISIYMIYLIAKLIVKDKWKILIVILTCLFFMIRIANENPCTESIALPFTLIALYYIIKYLMDGNSFRNKEAVVTSTCFSVVLLLRPNLTILWVLFYVYMLIKQIRAKKIKELLKMILFSALGVFVVFLPVIIYFIANNALYDFFKCYILFNLKYLGGEKKAIIDVIMYFVLETNFILVLIAALYLVIFILRKRINKNEMKLAKFGILYFVIAFILVIMPRRAYNHYLISMIPTFIIPLGIILKYVESKKAISCITFFTCVVFIIGYINIQIEKKELYKNMNDYLNDLKQICYVTRPEDDVLILGNRAYIYLMTDRQYSGKYLFQIPVAYEDEEIADEVIEDINRSSPKFIVNAMHFIGSKKANYYEQQIKNILFDKYTAKSGYIYVRKDLEEED